MIGEVEVQVVLYQEDGRWIAQGLQFDVTASGSSPPEAAKRFAAKVGAEVVISLDKGEPGPLSSVPQAPKKFWAMYNRAQMTLVPSEVPIRVINDGPAPRLRQSVRIGELENA